MPRSLNDPSQAPVETPAGLRSMAARARRLARNAGDQDSSTKLIEFAEELEARAAALETAPQVITHAEAAAIQKVEDHVGPEKNG